MGAREDIEHEGYGEEMEEDEMDEEQRMLDQRVPQIVNQFFEQNSDQRFNYLQGLKQLLTKQLEKKFEDAKNSLLPEEAQMKKSECNEEEDDDQDSDDPIGSAETPHEAAKRRRRSRYDLTPFAIRTSRPLAQRTGTCPFCSRTMMAANVNWHITGCTQNPERSH